MSIAPIRSILLLSLLGILGGMPLLLSAPHRIDEAHFMMVRNGMSVNDVVELFGAQPGNYDGAINESVYEAWREGAGFQREDTHLFEWTSRFGSFLISFSDCSPTGRVTKGRIEASIVPSWSNRARWRLSGLVRSK
jgi:hypothetical protein